MRRKSKDLSLSESCILASYARKHMGIQVPHSLDSLHMAQEELHRRKEFWDAVRSVPFNDFLEVTQCHEMHWKYRDSRRGANPRHGSHLVPLCIYVLEDFRQLLLETCFPPLDTVA